MRILIIKPSSLGDVVHALPTVNLIRKRYPDAFISWLINEPLQSLLKHCPVIDEVMPFRRHDYVHMTGFTYRLWRARFDIALDLRGLLRSGVMIWVAHAPRSIGLSDAREGSRYSYNEIVEVPRIHAVDRYLLAARHLGCDAGPIEFPLGVSPDIKSEGLIAVNPCSRWPAKLWGDDNFAELVRRLPRERVVLTGSAREREQVEQIAQGRRNLAGKTDLFELAELYARCSVVISNDSGPMHVAAAVGTPVVAIFGPTDPSLSGPYGKKHVVLRSDLPCSPCRKPKCSRKARGACMSLITVEQVLAAAEPFLV